MLRIGLIVIVLGIGLFQLSVGEDLQSSTAYHLHRRDLSDEGPQRRDKNDEVQEQQNAELIKSLSNNYDMWAIPGNVNVSFRVYLTCAILDESTHVLSSAGYSGMKWRDYRLTWNPDEYTGVEGIMVPTYHLWIPDITLYNSMYPEPPQAWQPARIKNDGSVWMSQAAYYKTLCSPAVDGVHNCTFKFGSWTYDGFQMTLNDEIKSSAHFYDNCPYEVVDFSQRLQETYYTCCPEPYPDYTITMSIKKRSA
jgi:hypothetical protein